MKLTSKGRYAVTAMLDVALHSKRGPVPLADISERQDPNEFVVRSENTPLPRKHLMFDLQQENKSS